ncbi:MAG: 4Fe-4S dicluster domain-containing protein [Cytophagaceae bacterium]|jgi:iron only hydrogenase large subunit-like protein|nr:4Fe-4S dicluster domain-containing protein [Cytophagaceae bacterium]
MSQLISVDPQKCNLSFTCIRACPAKAIKVQEKHAQVIPSRCIGCGNCFAVCAQNALVIRDEKAKAKELIESDAPVAAICDPSISGEFTDITDYRKFVAMIRALGFTYVLETAIGVDLIAFKYRELFNNFHGKFYITANCPSVVSYIEMYHPELTDNIAPIAPSYVAMAKVVRRFYGDDIKTVLLTSCAAAKDDVRKFKDDGRINAVLTFRELRELFAEKNITQNFVEYSDFDAPVGRKGGLLPASRGMLQAVDINQELLSGNILSAIGRNNFLDAISEFKTEVELHQHLDLFYCEGCVMGPGMSPGGKKYLRRSEVIKYVNKRLKSLDLVAWHEQIDSLNTLDLSRKFTPRERLLPQPQEQEILQVLRDMGKTRHQDQLNCGSCGYPNCREFAIAYCQGLTNFEMCYSYTTQNLHSYLNKLNLANEKLRKTQDELHKSENKAKQEEQAAREAAETVTLMLDKISAGVVIVDENLNIVESNRSFVEMAGDDARMLNEVIPGLKGAELKLLVPFHKLFSTVLQSGEDLLNRDTPLENTILNISVFTIKKRQVVGGIIRDLTAPDVKKEEIVNRAQQVIRENLETVQQIAFLLGESASNTEKILRSIINTQEFGLHMDGGIK